MRANFKLILSAIAGIFFAILIFEFFLRSELYIALYRKLPTASYFYLPYEWEKKILTQRNKKFQTLILGTSRSTFGISSPFFKNSFNFSLTAASNREIGIFISKLKSIENSNDLIIELNPMAITSRHYSAMESQKIETLIQDDFPLISSIKLRSEIYLNRNLLQEIFHKSLKPNQHHQKEDSFQAYKSQIYFDQFKVIRTLYNGDLDQPKSINPNFQNRIFNECEIMVNWSYDDGVVKDTESKNFKLFIESISKLNANIYFWIPPINPKSIERIKAQKYLNLIKNTLLEYKITFIDLNDLLSADEFNDCVHVNRRGKIKLSSSLKIKIDKIKSSTLSN